MGAATVSSRLNMTNNDVSMESGMRNWECTGMYNVRGLA